MIGQTIRNEQGDGWAMHSDVLKLDSTGSHTDLSVAPYHKAKVALVQVQGTGWDSAAATITLKRSLDGEFFESASQTFTGDDAAGTLLDVTGDHSLRLEVTTASGNAGDLVRVVIFAQTT